MKVSLSSPPHRKGRPETLLAVFIMVKAEHIRFSRPRTEPAREKKKP